MKTRTLARPVVLLLSNGLTHAYFQLNPDSTAPPVPGPHDFGRPEVFVPQKVRAKRRLLALAAVLAVAGILSTVYLVYRITS